MLWTDWKCKTMKEHCVQIVTAKSSFSNQFPLVLFLLSLWWSLVYLCKQAVAVCDILLLQQLSFPGPDAGCLSLRGQLPSDLPVSLNKRWQGTLQYISSKYRGYKPFLKSNNRLLSAVRGVCFQIVMHLWLLSLEIVIFVDLFAIHSLL